MQAIITSTELKLLPFILDAHRMSLVATGVFGPWGMVVVMEAVQR